MTHAELCEKIAAHLKALPDCWFFRPNNFGYGRRGVPDFIVCRWSYFYSLEVKVGRDEVSPWQARERDGILAAGGHWTEFRNFPDDLPEGLK